jgi:hypothetical protein
MALLSVGSLIIVVSGIVWGSPGFAENDYSEWLRTLRPSPTAVAAKSDYSGSSVRTDAKRSATTLICSPPADTGLTETPWVLRIDTASSSVEMVVHPRGDSTLGGIQKGNRLGRVSSSERDYSILFPADPDPLGAMQFAFVIDRFTGRGKLEIGELKYGDTAKYPVYCAAGPASPKL